jgi:hypothetical protein
MKIITTPMESMPGNRTIVLMANGEQIVYYQEEVIAYRTVAGLWGRLEVPNIEMPVHRWLNWYLAKVEEDKVTEYNKAELEFDVSKI